MIAHVRKLFGLSILLFAIAGCALQERKPAYDGWSLLATMPVANSEIAVAELAGRIYVIGGYPWDRKTVATVQMYDPAANASSSRSNTRAGPR